MRGSRFGRARLHRRGSIIVTFAQLVASPSLLTPDLRSPILHPDGTLTVLWEGDPGEGGVGCLPEWAEAEIPLTQIPGAAIWGADLQPPSLPPTVCIAIPTGRQGRPLPSPRHNPVLIGPAAPPPVGAPKVGSTLVADATLPLAGEERRVRIWLPPGADEGAALPILVVLDAQLLVDRSPAFPRITDRLREDGRIAPVILVALDNAGPRRPEEFQSGTAQNEAARAWIGDAVLPWVRQRYPSAGPTWLLAFSMGASFATQVLLGRPKLFAGGALLSPIHAQGQESVFETAVTYQGGHRLWLSHGDLGRLEAQSLSATENLAAVLADRGATLHLERFPGFGHNLESMVRAFGPALMWLLESATI